MGRTAVVFILIFASLSTFAADESIEARYDQFRNVEQMLAKGHPTDAEKSAVIGEAYEKFLAADQKDLTALATADVERLFQAARLAAFYTLKKKYVFSMLKDVSELKKRNSESSLDYRNTYDALLGVREFDAAKLFAERNSSAGLPTPPVIAGEKVESGPSLLVFTDSGITQKAIHLESGMYLIVVGHPLCHYTQNAVASIERDPEIRSALNRYAVWVAPQDMNLNADLFRKWNADHPLAALSVVYDRSLWPSGMEDWSTPTFYFVRKGQVVEKVIGWPADGNRAAVVRGFRALGIEVSNESR